MKIQLIIIVLLFATVLKAQKAVLPKYYTPLSITVKYGVQKPFGILAQRFGVNNNVGVGIEKISIPKGWIMGAESYFIYGSKVKEDVLKTIRTPEGTILGDIGSYAGVALKERGIYIGAHLGKFFVFNDNGNRVSGLRLAMGAGFLKHKIRILNEDNSAQQVGSPYAEGYDRMTYGMAFSQSIGYQFISRNKTVNFTLSLDFTEGVTRNRRGFNFDTRQRDDSKRLDFLSGLHATWSIPVFTNQKADEIEY
jgi:hypothetical protein